MKQDKDRQFMLKSHSSLETEQGLLAHFKDAVRCDITNMINKGTPKVYPSTTVNKLTKTVKINIFRTLGPNKKLTTTKGTFKEN